MLIGGYVFYQVQASSYGSFFCKLRNWDERKEKGQDVNSIIGMLYQQTASIKDAQILIFAPPMISGYSMTNGFEMNPSGQDRW